MKKKIIKVPYGLASAYDEHIEINEKLKGDLKKQILEHELSHITGRYTMKDFKIDFNAEESHFYKAFFFSLKNPEALINYFPIMYSYYFKVWTYNSSAVFPCLYFGMIWSIFWYLLFNINIFNIILAYLIFYVIINIILLLYTHYYVLEHKN